MDLDAYVLTHSADWRRLDELAGRRSLSGAESDELVELYQRVATHLSVVRTSAPDAGLIAHLSSVLARARQRTVGTRATTWRGVRDFFTQRFPAALYRLRWWWLGTLAANVVVIGVMMWWLLGNPASSSPCSPPTRWTSWSAPTSRATTASTPPRTSPPRSGSTTRGSPRSASPWGSSGRRSIWLLFQNIANLAIIGSIMTRHDHAAHFWGLILPHGLLELTAVFVAGGVGLRLFWSWIEPGPLTRAQSLAREGRTAGTVALGLVAVLALSGLIEGFVTPSPLPTWARVGIGILAELAFFAYVFVLGRNAVHRGHTGDVDAALLEDRVATQA